MIYRVTRPLGGESSRPTVEVSVDVDSEDGDPQAQLRALDRIAEGLAPRCPDCWVPLGERNHESCPRSAPS